MRLSIRAEPVPSVKQPHPIDRVFSQEHTLRRRHRSVPAGPFIPTPPLAGALAARAERGLKVEADMLVPVCRAPRVSIREPAPNLRDKPGAGQTAHV